MLITAALLISGFGHGQGLRINEVMLAQDGSWPDQFNDVSAWVELYNASGSPVQLSAYALSSRPHGLTRWQFPNLTLEPDSFLVIRLSGRDVREGEELHTNFKVRNAVDGLWLFQQNGQVADSIPPTCVPQNWSFTRIPDGSGSFQHTQQPSPAATNNNSQSLPFSSPQGQVSISKPTGFYASQTEVELNAPAAFDIRYTLNTGDEPETSSLLYNEPLQMQKRNADENVFSLIPTTENEGNWNEPVGFVRKSNVLRAAAFWQGCRVSAVATANYWIDEEQPASWHEVDVVAVTTESGFLFDDNEGLYVLGNNENFRQRGAEWERPVHLAFVDSSGSSYFEQDGGLRIHGGGTREGPQKSLRLYARSEYGTSWFDYPFFEDRELDRYKRLILRMSMGDWTRTLFKDDLCHYLIKDMNVGYQSSKPTVVYLNGEYWGIHNLRERQDGRYLEQHYNADRDAIEVVSYELFYQAAVVTDGDGSFYENLLSFLRSNDLSDDANYELALQLMDVDNMIDHYIAHFYFSNLDFPNNNNVLWRETTDDGIWRWLFFDCDACMIRTQYNQLVEHLSDINIHNNPDWSMEILRSFFRNRRFAERFVGRFRELISENFRADRVIEAIDSFEATYAPLIPEHIQRWGYPDHMLAWRRSVQDLRVFALSRPRVMADFLNRYFDAPFVLYPNPAAGGQSLNLRFHRPENVRDVTVFNMQGQVVMRFNGSEHAVEEITLQPTLPQGVYAVRVILNGQFHTQRWVVGD